MLKVENLSKAFGKTLVLNNISFDIKNGEIVCIKGKSGEGKTTLLRCLNSLEVADKGSIRIKDKYLFREVNGKIQYASKEDLKELRQEIGILHQSS